MKILVTLPRVFDSTKKILECSGHDIVFNKNGKNIEHGELKHLIKDVDGIIAGVEIYDDSILTNNLKIKCISRVGTSTKNIDKNYAKEKGIKIISAPTTMLSNYLAESIFSMSISIMLNLEMRQNIRPTSLKGLNVLIIGYDDTAKHLIKLFDQTGALI